MSGAPAPIEQIEQARREQVPSLYPSWAGRWLLIGDGDVHVDASALLGCFYGSDEHGRTWASSSPAVLAKALESREALQLDARSLRYERGVSWYVPPRSRIEGVRRLLPSQVLELRSGRIRPRPLLPPIEPERGYDETLELLGEALVTALRQLPTTRDPVWLSLSAGLDSRVILAAAQRGQVPFVPFTRIAARMSVADRLIPAQLARTLGRSLETHRRPARQRGAAVHERWRLVMAHSAGHVSEGDAQPLLHGVRDTLEGISVGGWAFGVGKALERKRLPATVNDAQETARVLADAMGEAPESSAEEALREWLDWLLQTQQDHLDWRDRFHLEQRLAGWLSSKEQVYDLATLERFPAINAARSYALLLGIDEARRLTKRHQRDLVERLCPALAGIPANPPDRHFGLRRVVQVKLRDDPRGLARKGASKLARLARLSAAA